MGSICEEIAVGKPDGCSSYVLVSFVVFWSKVYGPPMLEAVTPGPPNVKILH